MDKIRLITNGGYGNVVCKPGDVLEVSEWFDGACEAYVPSVSDHLYFHESEFEKLELEDLYVVIYDSDSIEGPVDYDNALFIWQTYVEEGYDARIAKLTWLD